MLYSKAMAGKELDIRQNREVTVIRAQTREGPWRGKGQEADHKTRWTNKALALSQRINLRLLNVQPPIRALGMCMRESGWAQRIF